MLRHSHIRRPLFWSRSEFSGLDAVNAGGSLMTQSGHQGRNQRGHGGNTTRADRPAPSLISFH